MARPTLRRTETHYGKPIRVLGRTLTPVACVSSAAQHRATVREHAVDGYGWVVVRARPVQIIETRNGEERILPIPDVTRATIGQMAVIAIVVSLASMALIAFTHSRKKRGGS